MKGLSALIPLNPGWWRERSASFCLRLRSAAEAEAGGDLDEPVVAGPRTDTGSAEANGQLRHSSSWACRATPRCAFSGLIVSTGRLPIQTAPGAAVVPRGADKRTRKGRAKTRHR